MHLSRRTDDFGALSGKNQPRQSPSAVCRLSVRPKTPKSRRALDDGFRPAAPVPTRLTHVAQRGTRRGLRSRVRRCTCWNVILNAALGFNLMSVGMMEERGGEASLKGGKAIIKIFDVVAACGTRKSGLYHLSTAPMSDVATVASLQLWHERLDHVNDADVKEMIKNQDVERLTCTFVVVKYICEPCMYGKAAMTPMPRVVGVCVTSWLHLVHSDLGGPMSEPSCGGALYLGTFTDEFSRWTDVIF